MPEVDLLKVREAARRLNVSENTVRRLVNDGDLTSVRIGRALRIPAHSVDELISGVPCYE